MLDFGILFMGLAEREYLNASKSHRPPPLESNT
jgi:hypothetical protein